MKKLLFALSILVLTTNLAFAVELETSGPLRKLQRGFLNVALSPMEVSNELAKEKTENADAAPPSWLIGLVRGGTFMVGRVFVGAYEIVTFPIPLPAGYTPILQPEFPWQKLPKN